jgi:hypothetical protein
VADHIAKMSVLEPAEDAGAESTFRTVTGMTATRGYP